MRVSTYLALMTVPLALAACDTQEDNSRTAEMPMATEDMPMADGRWMTETGSIGRMANAEGTVTAIDSEAGTIAIDHGPVAAVGWPAMTMAFSADEASRQKVAVGDKVTFSFELTEGGGKLTSISNE